MPWINKDYTGQKFNSWTFIERDLSKMRPIYWFCRCDCGSIHSILLQTITRNQSKRCTVCQALKRCKVKVGEVYGNLTVIGIEKVDGKVKAKVRCACNNERYYFPSRLTLGIAKSCGSCNIMMPHRKRINRLGKLGETYGLLTIIEDNEDKTFEAKCKCGNTITVKRHHLTTKMPSCGCYWKDRNVENAKKYIGMKWGRIKVVKFLRMDPRAIYRLRCKCGKFLERDIGHMFDIRSCGCLHADSAVRGEDNVKAKLTNSEVATLRELFKSGLYNRKELSEMMNIKYSHVCSLLNPNKKIWMHI